jgi:hypothetical protein
MTRHESVLAPLDLGNEVGIGLPSTDGDSTASSYGSRDVNEQVIVGSAIPAPSRLSHSYANATPRRDDVAPPKPDDARGGSESNEA